MTQVALAPPRIASAPSGRRRLAEFMLAGGATLIVLPLAWLLTRAVGLSSADYAVGFATFYAAYVINDPHFAVTYLLFYEDARARVFGSAFGPAQRARYVLAGFVVPATLVAWAATAWVTRSAQSLGWMMQLMFLLVGWHYVKQGFGVLVVLAGRRGAAISARERVVLLAHCYAAWAFAWANPAAPSGEFEEKGVVYWAPAHPRWLELGTGAALAVTTVALAATLGAMLRREGRLFPLAPLVTFLVTVWAWTIFSSVDPLLQYMIPALHSIQYLYVVALMKGNEARAEEGPPSFGRPAAVRLGALATSAVALGWLVLRAVPSVLDAALVPHAHAHALGAGTALAPLGPLGETPFFATAFVIVNIHHYCMDAVIWRRENQSTRFLRAA